MSDKAVREHAVDLLSGHGAHLLADDNAYHVGQIVLLRGLLVATREDRPRDRHGRGRSRPVLSPSVACAIRRMSAA